MTQTTQDAFDDFANLCRQAISEQVSGRTQPFQALWSNSDDVVLIGASGSHQVGWKDVSVQLTWASQHLSYTSWTFENLLIGISNDLAFTVDLEHMRDDAGHERTLRASQGYRYEYGGWRVIFRHADPMAEPVVLPERGDG